MTMSQLRNVISFLNNESKTFSYVNFRTVTLRNSQLTFFFKDWTSNVVFTSVFNSWLLLSSVLATIHSLFSVSESLLSTHNEAYIIWTTSEDKVFINWWINTDYSQCLTAKNLIYKNSFWSFTQHKAMMWTWF